MTTVKNVPAKLYYKQKYDQYKQLLDTKLRQDVSQGSNDNVIQDYHAGSTRGEPCTKYNLSYFKLKIMLRDEQSSKIPTTDIAVINYRTLNHSLSEPIGFTVSGVANDKFQKLLGYFCHYNIYNNYATQRY
ncbi:hypothetical protein PROFUN_15897 [Planoprotostelium fungivorum]|uniref:Uncharacterized protein n=1 Tax=Planoprotostelium fungivorum TaxID=1890364 RepID=A0A2P6MU50_9EUKA|nr:hypothetical protein PROFUN_15897 [Planoprotostelium fungivorum]